MIEYRVQVNKDGTEHWYNSNDQIHREGDKPAYIDPDGHKEYWIKGKRHREKGPSVIFSDGRVQYWLNGEKIAKEEHERRTKHVLEITIAELETQFGCKVRIVKDKTNPGSATEADLHRRAFYDSIFKRTIFKENPNRGKN